jgi:hypothetical protein
MSAVKIFKGARENHLEIRQHWLAVLLLSSIAIQVVQAWRLIAGYDRLPMTPDAGIFQHIGWYLTEGGRLYVDAWEPKLPLSFETTAILATLSGGDMRLFHLMNVGLMVAVTVGIVALVGLLAFELTGDGYASILAGFSMYLLAGFAVRPAYGYKAKYLLLFTGLLAVYLFLHDHPLASGAAAAASVGYWQLGAIFPLLVVGLAVGRRERDVLAAVVIGGVAFTAAMLVPVVALWNSGSEMVAQALVIPMLVDNEASLGEKVLAGVLHFKWASPFVLVGAYGAWRGSLADRNHRNWWAIAGAAQFAMFVFFLDFDTGGYTDLIPGLAFVELGIGLLGDSLMSDRRRIAFAGAVALLVVLNLTSFGSIGVVFPGADTSEPVSMDDLVPTSARLSSHTFPTMPPTSGTCTGTG